LGQIFVDSQVTSADIVVKRIICKTLTENICKNEFVKVVNVR